MSGERATAAGIARRVRAGEASAVEVVREHLDRIERIEPKVDAFLEVGRQRALIQAAAVDGALASGADLPLAGVPVAIKDLMHVDGFATTCGSRILEGYEPAFTATVVERLERAGAVVVGKTNMDEFAMGSSTENSAFKPTRNPWDATRVPGGSSGGSAAAVAAGMVPLALGSDTGGSIRQPASLCGVVGHKPTYGRVSRYGLVAFASSLDQIGPFTTTVEDAALAAGVMFGRDPNDATSADVEVPDFASALGGGVAGLRVGVPWAFLEKGVDPRVMAAFRESLRALEAAGARVVDVALPHAGHAIATYYIVATAEASSNLARFDGVRYGLRVDAGRDLRETYGRTRERGFGAEVKRRIILGTFALSSGYYDAYYARAQRVRSLIRRDFETALAQSDVVATPTAPSPAFRFGEKSDPLEMYLADVFTVPANLSGNPGLSVPCGFADGLPVGLQLVGRAFDEATLFRAAHAYQSLTDHHRRAPAIG
jgi:aspartyl-tRNA(Asn)/glutamyl-tRNA(Gln) amidotransferase subunit A